MSRREPHLVQAARAQELGAPERVCEVRAAARVRQRVLGAEDHHRQSTSSKEDNVRRILRFSPSPAMVIACAALLVALTGTSIAAVEASVPKNSVGSAQLKNNAVTAAKIASNAVTAAKIASNAVTGAKIAANAVTGAKVADGSLVAADFGAGQLPADAYARFLDGPIVIPASSTSIATLTIPQAGMYLLFGKLYATGPLATVVTCRLDATGDFDQSEASISSGSPASLSLMVAHNFTAASTVNLLCSGSVPGAAANFIKLSAIRLASLTNSG
jgi:hypothetical protein